VLLGNTQTFTATVSGTADSAVNWAVNGVAGGNSSTGTISADGVYTAPAILPSPAAVTVRATSHADATKYAEAAVTVASDVSLSLTPGAASIELGAVLAFHAVVTSNGHPDTAVNWSLTGIPCPASCGTVDAAGNYTAPRTFPSPATFTLVAQSAADASKKASAAITITSTFTLVISAPASVAPGATATLSATLQPAANSNPDTAISWSLSGAGCSGSACGTLGSASSSLASGGATVSTISYTAPPTAPSPASVTVTATPAADTSRAAQAAIAIGSGGGTIALSPASATRAAGQRLALGVTSSLASGSTLNWSVNGIAGGNTTVGQICAAGSNPCQTVTATSAAQVDYLAPAAIPTTNPVTVRATSQADSTVSGAAQVTVIAHVVVSVSPGALTLAPAAQQQFAATVLGTDNQNVVWQVSGAGCTGAACGTIDASGIYTAPPSAPSPASVTVRAISSADTSQSGSAAVNFSTGPAILGLLPASVYAGGAAGFTLLAEGSGFVPSSPGPGSTLLIGGTPRLTTCLSAQECMAPVSSTDVAVAGNFSVQIQNPGGSLSNTVSLVVLAPPGADELISLTASSPAATGKDIVVVETSSAGGSLSGSSLDLNVAALGLFSAATNTCTLGGNALAAARPSSGSVSLDICLFSWSGLDTSMAYSVTGPAGADDVTVAGKQSAGLGIIHLTLQIPASAAPGPRTIFIQNTNLDKTAATGALEVR
jgi:hypothetical protein